MLLSHKPIEIFLLVGLCLWTMIWAPGAAAAEVAYFLAGDAPQELRTWDLESGDIATVAPLAVTLDAMAFDRRGRLVGVTPDGQRLVSIDPASGRTVASVDLIVPAGEALFPLEDLAVDSSGTILLLSSQPFGALESKLLEADPRTGSLARVATFPDLYLLGLGSDQDGLVGLGLDARTVGMLYRLDPVAQQAEPLLEVNASLQSGGASDAQGRFVTIFSLPGGAAGPTFHLLAADPGAGTVVGLPGQLDEPASALALAPAGALPVPSLSGLGLALLALLLAGFAVTRLSSRQASAG